MRKPLILFDVDGTLTPPMSVIPDSMVTELIHAHQYFDLGIVTGSDRGKTMKQLGSFVLDDLMDYAFHENGSVFYQKGVLVHEDELEDVWPTSRINDMMDYLLRLVSIVPVPERVGHFIERRHCMINVSPIGRACSQMQRESFFSWDEITHTRELMADQVRASRFGEWVDVSIGGMISIDIFPKGFSKVRCLKYLKSSYEEIHFVGDRCYEGGNDYEIYQATNGHITLGFRDTELILRDLVEQRHCDLSRVDYRRDPVYHTSFDPPEGDGPDSGLSVHLPDGRA